MQRKPRFRSQPQGPVVLDQTNPLTRGLVFCAWPVGNTYLDLVTGVYGTPVSTAITASVRSPNGGFSTDTGSLALQSNGSVSDFVRWPTDTVLRGGNLDAVGTLLCLGGSTTQVDGNIYRMGGNTDAVNIGNGFGLAIDSFQQIDRGNILSTNYTTPLGSSLGQALCTTLNNFGNQTHFFGYSFNSNGVSGNWFYRGEAHAYSGSAAHGAGGNAQRRAYVLVTGASQANVSFVQIFLIWERELSPDEYAALYRNPWQLVRPAQRTLFAAAGGAGGTAYFGDMVESLSFTDAASATGAFAAAAAESLTLTAAQAATAAFTAAEAESLTLTDAASATGAFTSAQAESITLVDAAAASAAFLSAQAESLTLSDTVVWLGGSISGDIVESIALTDALAATGGFVGAVSENLTPVDTVTGIVSMTVAQNEAFTIFDIVSYPPPPPPPDTDPFGGGGPDDDDAFDLDRHLKLQGKIFQRLYSDLPTLGEPYKPVESPPPPPALAKRKQAPAAGSGGLSDLDAPAAPVAQVTAITPPAAAAPLKPSDEEQVLLAVAAAIIEEEAQSAEEEALIRLLLEEDRPSP